METAILVEVTMTMTWTTVRKERTTWKKARQTWKREKIASMMKMRAAITKVSTTTMKRVGRLTIVTLIHMEVMTAKNKRSRKTRRRRVRSKVR